MGNSNNTTIVIPEGEINVLNPYRKQLKTIIEEGKILSILLH